jgi:hypothetical protein
MLFETDLLEKDFARRILCQTISHRHSGVWIVVSASRISSAKLFPIKEDISSCGRVSSLELWTSDMILASLPGLNRIDFFQLEFK